MSSDLGMLYTQGKGVAHDDSEAAKRFRNAADQGDALGQAKLRSAYKAGEGITQDYVHAHMWFSLAASGASGDHQNAFASARDSVAAQMTSAQIAEPERLAREWQPSTAK